MGFSTRSRRALPFGLAITLVAAALVASVPTPVGATEISQSVVVNPDPVNYTPNVLNGKVLQFARIGTTIYVAGSFTQVQAPTTGAPVLNRTNLFAFNVNTGAISTTWIPAVNGEVNSLQAMPDGSGLFLGGKFRTVNGVASRGVAKVNPTTGASITAFSAPTNADVTSLALTGNRLFVGGKFSTIKGVSRSRLAAVNTTTGAVETGFNIAVTNPFTAGTSLEVSKMDVTPAGDRLVIIGNFRTVGGQDRAQMGQIDLTTNTVSDWRTDDLLGACASVFNTYTRDVQYSPDGAYFVLVTTGAGYYPETLCDTATRWETYAPGAGQRPTWTNYSGGDTFYSVAITGAAVYVGGHMRWMNNAAVGDFAAEGAVSREGIAALDPQSGIPLRWNPGRTRGVGVFDMLATPQGLLVGSDTTRLAGEARLRLGMFPTAGGTAPVVASTATLPGNLFAAPRKLCAAQDVSVLFRVNTGGGRLDSLDCGPDWAGDEGSSPYRSDESATAGWSQVTGVTAAVPSATPSEVFNTERWYYQDNSDSDWEIPVAAGTNVQVRLYFANRCSCTSAVGSRIFDVTIEGAMVMDDYDIVSDVGDQVGTMKSFDLMVEDGSVSIDTIHVTENPLINAIEIIDRDAPTGPAPSAVESLVRFAGFDGATPGTSDLLATPGVDWSTARGMFALNGRVYAGFQDGRLLSWAFNGTTLTGQQDVLVAGNYVLGPTWTSFAQMTGMYWEAGRLYYTKQGDDRLLYRNFTPSSQIVGSIEYVAAGSGWNGVRGMTEAGGLLFYSTSDGELQRVAVDALGVPVGPPSVLGGPLIDGRDYRSNGMFIVN